MKVNLKRAIFFQLFLMLLMLPTAFGQTRPKGGENNVESAEFCDVLQSPGKYAGKQIRLTAIYRYGLYLAELSCSRCIGSIEYLPGKSFSKLTKSGLRKKTKWSERGKTVNVVAVGRLSDAGHYGHLGQHKYQFVVDYLESAEVILNDSPVILPENVQQKAVCN